MAERLTITDKQPVTPNSDFAFYIDYDASAGSASRVFKATHDFIVACEKLDKGLVGSIDSSIETVLMIEDVEASSLKTYFRNALIATDDQALKDMDWKPAVGKYLVRAKYMILRWTEDDSTPRSLPGLKEEIRKLAEETDVRHLPDYAPAATQTIVNAITDFDAVKGNLLPSDKISLSSNEGTQEFNVNVRVDIEDIESLSVKETIDNPETTMMLAVKKPDFLGDSQWEFKHGKKLIKARIADETWINDFRLRKFDVRPGDALRCVVVVSYDYGFEGELLRERYLVVSVQEKIDNQYHQAGLFDDGDLNDDT